MSRLKKKKRKKESRESITLIEFVTKNMLIKEHAFGQDRIEKNGGKEYMWQTMISLLRIYNQLQNFGIKAWLLL